MTDTALLTAHAHDLSHHSSSHSLGAWDAGTIDLTTSSVVTVPGASIVVPAAEDRPYRIHFGGCGYSATIGVHVFLDLYEDGVNVGVTGGICPSPANSLITFRGSRRRMANRVDHTYALKLRVLGAGTVHLLGGLPGGPNASVFMWIETM